MTILQTSLISLLLNVILPSLNEGDTVHIKDNWTYLNVTRSNLKVKKKPPQLSKHTL